MRRHPFSIAELMVVIVLLAIVTNLGVILFFHATRQTRRSLEIAHRHQDLRLVSKRWRKLVNSCQAKSLRLENGVLLGDTPRGPMTVSIKDGFLRWTSDGVEKRARLPKDAEAEIILESDGTKTNHAVLRFKPGHDGDAGKPRVSRLVACPGLDVEP